MMKRPDMNDTLRNEGLDAVRERYDRAGNYSGWPGSNERVLPPKMLPSPAMPMPVARVFIEQCGRSDNGERTIRYWRGGWWVWCRSHWKEIDDREMRSLLYRFTENAVYLDPKHGEVRWEPTRHRISNLVEALSAIALLSSDTTQPTCRSVGLTPICGPGNI